MKIMGKIYRKAESKYYTAEFPLLNLSLESTIKEELPELFKVLIEFLTNKPEFSVNITAIDNNLYLETNKPKILMSLILKNQRERLGLKQHQAIEILATTTKEYREYEHGSHELNIETLQYMLRKLIKFITDPINEGFKTIQMETR
jgi:hypothetical protein